MGFHDGVDSWTIALEGGQTPRCRRSRGLRSRGRVGRPTVASPTSGESDEHHRGMPASAIAPHPPLDRRPRPPVPASARHPLPPPPHPAASPAVPTPPLSGRAAHGFWSASPTAGQDSSRSRGYKQDSRASSHCRPARSSHASRASRSQKRLGRHIPATLETTRLTDDLLDDVSPLQYSRAPSVEKSSQALMPGAFARAHHGRRRRASPDGRWVGGPCGLEHLGQSVFESDDGVGVALAELQPDAVQVRVVGRTAGQSNYFPELGFGHHGSSMPIARDR